MYLVGKKITKELLEKSGIYSTGHPTESVIIDSAINRFGGVSSDYSVFIIGDSSEDARRVLDGDEFLLLWENDIIKGISFQPEDSKNTISVSCSKSYIIDDGLDEAVVNIEILDSSENIDSNFNDTVLIPIRVNGADGYKRVVFVNGVASVSFTGSQMGRIIMPSNPKRVGALKVKNSIRINIVMS